jgi:4'-phosphopantetheinyl transferase
VHRRRDERQSESGADRAEALRAHSGTRHAKAGQWFLAPWSPRMPTPPIRLSAPMPFELWLVPLAADRPEDGALLDEQERERAARFAFERDRRRYVAAHVALRRLLGQRTGRAPDALRFETGAFGKPRLRGELSCAFSLSHSDDHALIAISAGDEVGVDLEPLRPLPDIDALARQCLAKRECFHLDATPVAERELAFLRAWTRKEACLKALGTGLQVDPASFEAGIDTSELQVRIDTPEGVREVVVHSLSPMPGWVAALAWAPRTPKEGVPGDSSNLYSAR